MMTLEMLKDWTEDFRLEIEAAHCTPYEYIRRRLQELQTISHKKTRTDLDGDCW
jgi:hypothetical protein